MHNDRVSGSYLHLPPFRSIYEPTGWQAAFNYESAMQKRCLTIKNKANLTIWPAQLDRQPAAAVKKLVHLTDHDNSTTNGILTENTNVCFLIILMLCLLT